MKKIVFVVLSCMIILPGCAKVTPINDGSGYDSYIITVGGYNSVNDLFEEANKLCGNRGFTPLSASQSGPDAMYTMYGPVLSSQKTLIIRCNQKQEETVSSANK